MNCCARALKAVGCQLHRRSKRATKFSVTPRACLSRKNSIKRMSEIEEMKNALETIKPQVRALRAYSLTPEVGRIKINQNENPFDASRRIKDETLRRMSGRAWSRYPDFVPLSLHEKLAEFANWRADGIVAGNGSNELIQSLLMVTIAPGKRALVCEPTFALYRQVTTILSGEIVSVPLDENLSFDTEKILRKIEESQPDVVVLCSPNNPTGCVIGDEDLRRILEVARGIVAVDEAYCDFADHTIAPLLSEFSSLVVFRTFSKAMAMAALRVGYLLAAPDVAREISKAVLPYNLNKFSQTAAEVALEFYDAELRPTIEIIKRERDRMFIELQKIEGLIPVPSHANFFVVRTLIPPKQVFNELLARGILVRDVSSYPMLADYFRLSVGAPEENDALIAALKEIFA